ncbi:MAG TPA: RagB/SusD family nutrient uptake outer membrane protein [Rikenellaceae bacterium]|nr:RagB/SusD family nutrient uptake outer membrane protein [Rikenellaceae bacterium]
MKAYKFILCVAVVAIAAVSCNDMDLEPKGIIDEGTLFKSDYGIKKYFAGIYNELPIEDFNYKASDDEKGYSVSNAAGSHNGNVWQAQKGSGSVLCAEATGRGNGDMSGAWGYWPYGDIRLINNFIQNFPDYKDNFTEQAYNEHLGEAYFLRAFFYFGMVKRYGGVPLVKEVLDPTAELESLRLPRSTEYDCWKFIHDDLEFAMENMTADKSVPGRANRYAAAALMSKAMLYAGSVAKYNQYTGVTGKATEAGLMGMVPSVAAEFFKYAYDACKFIKDGGYTLHDGSDKVAAYKQTFVELCSDEDIFVKIYGPKATTGWNMSLFHCWDTMVLPKGTNMANDVGAALHPVWDLVGLYETPAVVDENGNPVRFNELKDFWDNDVMEPRCKANFFFSGMTEPVSKTVLDIQAGVYTSYPGTAKDGCPDTNVETDYTQKYRIRGSQPGTVQKVGDYGDVKINGANGYATGTGDEGYSTTGVFIQKYVDYNIDPALRVLFGSTQPWKVFRYGEILCNWAEAAYELGLETGDENLKKEAFEHVNEIRNRAGAHPHEMVASPADIGEELYGFPLDENLKYIRDERKRELCFENQGEFDQRRWRISHAIYNNYYPKVLFGYKVLDENKYIFLNETEVFGRSLTYDKIRYYENIPGGEINKNPNLVRNDGY